MGYYTLTWLEFHPEYNPREYNNNYMVKKTITFTTKKALEWALTDIPKNNPRFFRFKKLTHNLTP